MAQLHGRQLMAAAMQPKIDRLNGQAAKATKPTQLAATVPNSTKPRDKAEGQRFLTAFGEKGGVWFAQGKTFEEARQLHATEGLAPFRLRGATPGQARFMRAFENSKAFAHLKK